MQKSTKFNINTFEGSQSESLIDAQKILWKIRQPRRISKIVQIYETTLFAPMAKKIVFFLESFSNKDQIIPHFYCTVDLLLG